MTLTPPQFTLAPGAGVLRPATPADEAFLYHLFAVDKKAELAGLAGPAADALVTMQFRGRGLTYGAEFPDARSWIVEQAGRPVARLLEDEEADALHVVDIAVAPEHRRTGIGRGLIAAMQAAAGGRGKGVRAHVFVDNGPSRAMFAGLGFEERLDPGEAYLGVLWRP